MKKTLVMLGMLLTAACTLSAGSLRIDVSGLPEAAVPSDATAGAVQRALPRSGGIVRSITFPAADDWKEFTFSITSPTACQITLVMRSTDSSWVAVDDITVENAKIANGDFEAIDAKKGRPATWKCSKANLETKVVKSGKSAGRIAYRSMLRQGNISIPANTKVTIKGFYRSVEANAKAPQAAGQKKK